MFCVNIKIPFEARLPEEMKNMRTWLDHHRFETVAFRQWKTEIGIVFNLHFQHEVEAAAFAAAFDGRLESASRTEEAEPVEFAKPFGGKVLV